MSTTKTWGELASERDALIDTIMIEPALAADAGEARAAVDGQDAQVAIIIPAEFSKQFADLNGEAFIEFYQDPALTIGPNIIRAILHRFMDGMAGVKIAVNVFIDEADPKDQQLAGQVAQEYLKISLAQAEDLEGELLDVRPPANSSPGDQAKSTNLLVRMIGPIMGGMMIFYAFYTGTSTAQSILREEEERTLPRLFTTPTSQAAILTGKFLAVFMTVFVQVITLLVAARLIFGIQWGNLFSLALTALGIVLSASSFGILVNSFLKNTRQGRSGLWRSIDRDRHDRDDQHLCHEFAAARAGRKRRARAACPGSRRIDLAAP